MTLEEWVDEIYRDMRDAADEMRDALGRGIAELTRDYLYDKMREDGVADVIIKEDTF